MPTYRIQCCDGETCEEIGTVRDPEVAKRKLTKAVRKRAKRLRKEKAPNARIYGEVREVNKGIVADKPLYVAEEHYGEPTKRGGRKSKPKPTE